MNELKMLLMSQIDDMQQMNKEFVAKQLKIEQTLNELGQLWNGARNQSQQGILDSLRSIADDYRKMSETVWQGKEKLEQLMRVL